MSQTRGASTFNPIFVYNSNGKAHGSTIEINGHSHSHSNFSWALLSKRKKVHEVNPTLSDKCVGSLTSPAIHITLKMQETGPTIYSGASAREARQRSTMGKKNW